MTLIYLQEILRARSPKSLRTACLLSKPSRRKVDVAVEYIGFTIEDRFVVGYGLDYAEKYRNLSHIAVLMRIRVAAASRKGSGDRRRTFDFITEADARLDRAGARPSSSKAGARHAA